MARWASGHEGSGKAGTGHESAVGVLWSAGRTWKPSATIEQPEERRLVLEHILREPENPSAG
jgi:hypothetical protein